jgi:hypothetical protein
VSVVEEVRAAFDAYEADLLANDVEALDRWFAPVSALRFAFGSFERDAAEVAAGRRNRPRQTEPRALEAIEVRAWTDDVASVFAVFRLVSGPVVHQSQTWARFDDGWHVVAAHVSNA